MAINLDKYVSFCSMYMDDSVVTRRNRPGRNYDVMKCDTRQRLPLVAVDLLYMMQKEKL